MTILKEHLESTSKCNLVIIFVKLFQNFVCAVVDSDGILSLAFIFLILNEFQIIVIKGFMFGLNLLAGKEIFHEIDRYFSACTLLRKQVSFQTIYFFFKYVLERIFLWKLKFGIPKTFFDFVPSWDFGFIS